MLALLSNLNLVTRVELTVSTAERNKLLTGSRIGWDGAVPSADGQAVVQVWSEANRTAEKNWTQGTAVDAADGTPRFSPDVEDSGQVTVIYGKYRALTNMYDSGAAPAVGDFLRADATKKLLEKFTPASGTSQHAFAICTKAPATYSHLGDDYTVIEFVTI